MPFLAEHCSKNLGALLKHKMRFWHFKQYNLMAPMQPWTELQSMKSWHNSSYIKVLASWPCLKPAYTSNQHVPGSRILWNSLLVYFAEKCCANSSWFESKLMYVPPNIFSPFPYGRSLHGHGSGHPCPLPWAWPPVWPKAWGWPLAWRVNGRVLRLDTSDLYKPCIAMDSETPYLKVTYIGQYNPHTRQYNTQYKEFLLTVRSFNI